MIKIDSVPKTYEELQNKVIEQINKFKLSLSEEREIRLDLTFEQKQQILKLLEDTCSGYYYIAEGVKNTQAPLPSVSFISFYLTSYPKIKITF